MGTIRPTSQFKKDAKRMITRRKDFARFKEVVKLLMNGEIIFEKYRDHPLSGLYIGKRECHPEPDWLLIYGAPI
jgi:mRNA interferase YafQ